MILVIFLLILIPFTTANYLLVEQMKKSLQESTYHEFLTLTKELGNEIDRMMIQAKNEITVIATDPLLYHHHASSDEINLHLHNVMNLSTLYDDITIIDDNQIVLSSIHYRYPGNLEVQEAYQKALAGEQIITKPKATSEPFRLAMVYLCPIYNETGNITGAVAGQVSLNHIWTILDDVDVGENGFVYLMDSDRNILAHADKSLVYTPMYTGQFKKDTADFHIQNDTGYAMYGTGSDQMICAYKIILKNFFSEPNDSWTLVITQPVKNALAGPIKLQNQMNVLFVVFSFLVGLIIFVFHKQIIQPIQILKKGMEKVAEGDFKNQVGIHTGDELEQLGASFNIMTEKLFWYETKLRQRTEDIQKLLRQKDEFVNQLGHDLKNPLTPLVNLIPFLEERESDEKKKQILGIIHRNVDYMKNLVVKTIDLAKLNSPNTKLSYEEMNLLDSLKNVLDLNQLSIENKHLHIVNTIPQDIVLIADAFRVEELLTNLLTNAMKYTKEQGTITFAVSEKAGEIEVSIQDDGIGMTKEQLERLFEEFYKGDESRHDFESSGLGMSIARSIVKKHGGRIWAESEGPGKGSRFHFILPKRPLQAPVEVDLKTSEDEKDIHVKIDKLLE